MRRRRFRTSCATRSKPTNTILIAREARPHARGALRAAAGAAARPTCGRSRLRRRGPLAPGLRGGAVYTDDKAPVEWLIDKSIVDYAAGDG